MAIALCSGHATLDGILHLRPTLVLSIEAGQPHPLKCRMGADCDGLAQLPLGRPEIAIFLRNRCSQLVRSCCVNAIQPGGDSGSLVGASTHYSRSSAVELA